MGEFVKVVQQHTATAQQHSFPAHHFLPYILNCFYKFTSVFHCGCNTVFRRRFPSVFCLENTRPAPEKTLAGIGQTGSIAFTRTAFLR